MSRAQYLISKGLAKLSRHMTAVRWSSGILAFLITLLFVVSVLAWAGKIEANDEKKRRRALDIISVMWMIVGILSAGMFLTLAIVSFPRLEKQGDESYEMLVNDGDE